MDLKLQSTTCRNRKDTQNYHSKEVQVERTVWQVSNISICNNYFSILLHNLKSLRAIGIFLESLQSLPLFKSHDLAKQFCQSRESPKVRSLGKHRTNWRKILWNDGSLLFLWVLIWGCEIVSLSTENTQSVPRDVLKSKQVLQPTCITKPQQYTIYSKQSKRPGRSPAGALYYYREIL